MASGLTKQRRRCGDSHAAEIKIHAHTVTVLEKAHQKGIDGRGMGEMPGGCNKAREDFFNANPSATASEIYQQQGRMM